MLIHNHMDEIINDEVLETSDESVDIEDSVEIDEVEVDESVNERPADNVIESNY